MWFFPTVVEVQLPNEGRIEAGQAKAICPLYCFQMSMRCKINKRTISLDSPGGEEEGSRDLMIQTLLSTLREAVHLSWLFWDDPDLCLLSRVITNGTPFTLKSVLVCLIKFEVARSWGISEIYYCRSDTISKLLMYTMAFILINASEFHLTNMKILEHFLSNHPLPFYFFPIKN